MERTMTALSIKQPWAWLIVHGYKTVENRTWKTGYRGPVLIHAGKSFDNIGYQEIKEAFPEIPLPKLNEFQFGGIIGQATLTDCVTQHSSPWFSGPYGFVFSFATPCEFTPCKGSLGFFSLVKPPRA